MNMRSEAGELEKSQGYSLQLIYLEVNYVEMNGTYTVRD